MTDKDRLLGDTEKFERACENLTGALERFAALAGQIATEFRTATAVIKKTLEPPSVRMP